MPWKQVEHPPTAYKLPRRQQRPHIRLWAIGSLLRQALMASSPRAPLGPAIESGREFDELEPGCGVRPAVRP